MSRLTKPDTYINNLTITQKKLFDCYEKLEKLEDIEEELGCPLDVVFKGMNGYDVEYKIRDEIVTGSISSIFKSVGNKWIGSFIPKRYVFGTRDYYTKNIELNQYQKTWWLKGDKNE
jgi:hypothetical protein